MSNQCPVHVREEANATIDDEGWDLMLDIIKCAAVASVIVELIRLSFKLCLCA